MASCRPVSGRGLVVVLTVMVCPACQPELVEPPQAPPSAEAEPARQPVAVRLRALETGDPVARAVQDAVRVELARAGFNVVDGGPLLDLDLLLTVASSASTGGSETRTIVTLSPTVGAHAMEDVSGHFVRSDRKVDPITVREVCQRFKRRYQRFQGVAAGGER